MPQDIKAVLFDLDGTLIDSSQGLIEAMQALLDTEGKPQMDEQDLQTLTTMGARQVISNYFSCSVDSQVYLDLRAKFMDFYRPLAGKRSRCFAGIAELLQQLDELKIPWGVATNKPRLLSEITLDYLGYSTKFLWTPDDVKFPKPAGDMLVQGCQALNVTSSQCLFVGDTWVDCDAAAAIDMPFAGCLWGYDFVHFDGRKPTYLLEKPADILPLLNS